MDTQSSTYKPKENHPWRRYRNRFNDQKSDHPVAPRYSIKNFLESLATEWDTYAIPSPDPATFNEPTKIKFMGDDKIAEWLVDIVKRNWLTGSRASSYL